MRRCTSAAPASRSMRITERCVVPRTMESSTTTSRLPAMASVSGFSLRRTASARAPLVGRDEGAADVAVLDQPLAVGDAAGAGETLGGGHPRLGHPHHHVGLGRRLRRQQLAHAAAGLVDLPAVEPAVGPRDVGELEDAQPRLAPRAATGPRGSWGPSASITTSSPGATSRTKVAPMTLSAGVSEASTQPSGASAGPSRPRHSGRKPRGSRTPNSRSELMRTKENAPSRIGQHQLQGGGEVLGLGEGLGQQLGHHVAVGGDGTRQHPDLLGQGGRCWSGSRCGPGRSRRGPPGGRRAGPPPSPRRRASSSGCGRWPDGPAAPRGCARRRRWRPGPCP